MLSISEMALTYNFSLQHVTFFSASIRSRKVETPSFSATILFAYQSNVGSPISVHNLEQCGGVFRFPYPVIEYLCRVYAEDHGGHTHRYSTGS